MDFCAYCTCATKGFCAVLLSLDFFNKRDLSGKLYLKWNEEKGLFFCLALLQGGCGGCAEEDNTINVGLMLLLVKFFLFDVIWENNRPDLQLV